MKSYLLNEIDLKRFTDNIEPIPWSGCWEYLGSMDHDNYGVFYANGTSYKAHRMSAYLYHPDWNPDLDVCHHCDNPSCVNPSHFFMGTDIENVADRHRKGRTRNRQEPGEGHHMSKLTNEDVWKIRTDQRVSRLIAQEYGISPSQVCSIRRRASWAHLPEKACI